MREEHIPVGAKRCPMCGEVYPLAAFLIPGSKWTQPRAYCPGCRRSMTRRSMRRVRARRGKAGQCAYCGAPPAYASRYCLLHWARTIGANTGWATLPHAHMLLGLLDAQGYPCALSGLPMVPGENASIDHIVPKAKGGATVLENLQWVRKEVNIAKQHMSVDEFVAMCRAVVEHQQ